MTTCSSESETIWISFNCPGVLTLCLSTEMSWFLLLLSCLLPLLCQLILEPWPFSHVWHLHHQTSRLSKPAVGLRKGQPSVRRKTKTNSWSVHRSSDDDARCSQGLLTLKSPRTADLVSLIYRSIIIRPLVLPYSKSKEYSKVIADLLLLHSRKLEEVTDVFTFSP